MSTLAALLLFSSTAAPTAEAPPPARPQVTAIGVARARILAPVRLSVLDRGTAISTAASDGDRLITHQQPRRDGARVIDCY